jgi:curved DNA-binding protein CbpA
MNYYEELGIKPDADQEEIRKAHRRLVRLMHPDQHRDPAMKQLGEMQMRRLNSIVATLLDPERRREYDAQLRSGFTAAPVAQSAWGKVPWWIASTAGAVVLTVGAVWFWADHLGSSFNTRTPVDVTAERTASAKAQRPPEPASQTAAAPSSSTVIVAAPPPASHAEPLPEPSSRISATVVPSEPADDRWHGVAALPKSNSFRSVVAASAPKETKPKTFTLPVGARSAPARAESAPLPPPPGINPGMSAGMSASPAVRQEIASVTTPPLPAAVAPKPEPVFTSGDPAEGIWVYSPKEPEKHKPGFYPPTYISLKLKKKERGLGGQYNARYEVTDSKPISPDVSFQLTAVDKSSRKFVWEANNGSRGTLAIRSIEGRTMRLEWRTTVFTGAPALTSGIATLERREP